MCCVCVCANLVHNQPGACCVTYKQLVTKGLRRVHHVHSSTQQYTACCCRCWRTVFILISYPDNTHILTLKQTDTRTNEQTQTKSNQPDQVGEEAQKSVIQRIFQQVAQRPDSFCNYLEGIIPEWGEGTKLIYRHYATLYFVFAVDAQESDLGILDLVQGTIQKWRSAVPRNTSTSVSFLY